MNLLNTLTGFLTALTGVTEGPAPSTVTDLQIVTTFMPAVCQTMAKNGDKVQVHYTGTLFSDGSKFDSSLDRGQPFPLTLGVGQVIKGWDEGLKGMCVNEKRTLTIPSHMAYGVRGFPPIIPPSAALVFTVELIGLEAVGHQEL